MDVFEKCGRLDRLDQAAGLARYPYFIPLSSACGPEVTIEGRRILMLGSNNYLGLTEHPEVIEAAQQAVAKYGTGCTGSRLMNGTLDLHEEFEERLARFFDKEDCIVFTTGFQANLGTISALLGRHDVAIVDRADHASVIDGCRLGFGTTVKYRHNDLEDLERVLSFHAERNRGLLIIVDGVFSMEGDLATLPGIVELKNRYGARLLVDEAHGVGVLGEGGRGAADHFCVLDEVDLVIGTLSKSLASTGGFVVGDRSIMRYLRHSARSFLFSASLPPASAAAGLAALNVLEREPERRARPLKLAEMMKRELNALGFDTGVSESPIVPVVIGDDLPTAAMWNELFKLGVFTNAAVSPAVEPGRGLLRTSYMATHTEAQLERALDAFGTASSALGIIPSQAAVAAHS